MFALYSTGGAAWPFSVGLHGCEDVWLIPFTSTPMTLQLNLFFCDMLIDNYITVTVTVTFFIFGRVS